MRYSWTGDVTLAQPPAFLKIWEEDPKSMQRDSLRIQENANRHFTVQDMDNRREIRGKTTKTTIKIKCEIEDKHSFDKP